MRGASKKKRGVAPSLKWCVGCVVLPLPSLSSSFLPRHHTHRTAASATSPPPPPPPRRTAGQGGGPFVAPLLRRVGPERATSPLRCIEMREADSCGYGVVETHPPHAPRRRLLPYVLTPTLTPLHPTDRQPAGRRRARATVFRQDEERYADLPPPIPFLFCVCVNACTRREAKGWACAAFPSHPPVYASCPSPPRPGPRPWAPGPLLLLLLLLLLPLPSDHLFHPMMIRRLFSLRRRRGPPTHPPIHPVPTH